MRATFTKHILISTFLLTMPFSGMAQEHLTFKATSGLRKEFTGFLHRPAGQSKGTIVYLHGGACIFKEIAIDLKPSWTVELLLKSGWSVLILQYYENLSWNNDWMADNEVKKQLCEKNVNTILKDIPAAITQYREQSHEKNLFLLGHSFGGYVTNLIATQSPTLEGVNAFISLHGIWDSTHMYAGQVNRTVPASIRAIDRRPEDLQPILIVHSKDDGAVPFQQVADFHDWVIGSRAQFQVKIFENGGHVPGISPEWQTPPYPIDEFAETLLSFLEKYRKN